MEKESVEFGTSGHRGIIGESFTVQHVDAIAHAMGRWIGRYGRHGQVCIGCDPRPGNDPGLGKLSFTAVLAARLQQSGLTVAMGETFMPTPIISWWITTGKFDGGAILTASHNPPEYNGIKWNGANGAPAASSVTEEIESWANAVFHSLTPLPLTSPIVRKDIISPFVDALLNMVETQMGVPTGLIDFPVVIDANHGTAGRVWEYLVDRLGIQTYEIIHKNPASDFGGLDPNPTKLGNRRTLMSTQAQMQSPIAIANDPDADRHVILDENGSRVSAEEISVIILDYLIGQKAPIAGMATTVASSQLVKKACLDNKLEFFETAVGFKNFSSFLEASQKSGQLGFAVESSGGYTCSTHVLEKCGFLPAVLILLIMAKSGKSLGQLRTDIQSKYGVYHFREIELPIMHASKPKLRARFQEWSIDDVSRIVGCPVTAIDNQDGFKVVFPHSGWCLVRFSGTEPMVRLYAESTTPQSSQSLLQTAERLVQL